MQIPITKSKTTNDIDVDSLDLGFGKYFTDHMFLCDYTEKEGWHNPRIVPYGPLPLDPAASVLHYGQTIFEGLKAYTYKKDKVALFRPEFNIKRMNRSAKKLCMPEMDEKLFMQGLEALVRVDKKFIPKVEGRSLYIRPTMIGTEGFLGVREATKYIFYIILSPVSSYYKGGLTPTKIWMETKFVRASAGGIGDAKSGVNYAASLYAYKIGKSKGATQVLWTDGLTHKYFEEVGTMNVFFRVGDEVITPSLDEGTILAGGIREVVIELLKKWGYKITARKVSYEEILKAHKEKKLIEVFGTGTAAIIAPIGELFNDEDKLIINENKMGELSTRLYNEIIDIQHGKLPDTYHYMRIIE